MAKLTLAKHLSTEWLVSGIYWPVGFGSPLDVFEIYSNRKDASDRKKELEESPGDTKIKVKKV
jgi:hypothetical protein